MPKQKEKIYLAYGSNLNLKQMPRRCPTAEVLGTTELKGYDLKFRGDNFHAVATVEQGEGTVPALLWKIQPQDERSLDIYEGWPSFYRKESIEVELDGKPVEAMMYVMNDGYALGSPSNTYLQTIVEGYEDAGFDKENLFSIVDKSWQIYRDHRESVHTALCEKLDYNMEEYRETLLAKKPEIIFDCAEEIYTMQTIYEKLYDDNYPFEHAEYLLKLRNPLEAVYDVWHEDNNYILSSSVSQAVEAVYKQRDLDMEYELDESYEEHELEGEPQIGMDW